MAKWFVFILATAGLACSGLTKYRAYPIVRPVHRLVDIPDVKKSSVHIDLQSPAGELLYRIECHSAGYPDPNFDYSGEFECRLRATYEKTRFSTLFTEDPIQSRDWESRARFFGRSVTGDCARITQFGADRTFRLRGMVIRLRILQPDIDRFGKLKSLLLSVDVAVARSARTSITEAVKLPSRSPRHCEINRLFPT